MKKESLLNDLTVEEMLSLYSIQGDIFESLELVVESGKIYRKAL